MNVDLHAHYPMHLVPDGDRTLAALFSVSQDGRAPWRDRLASRLVTLASRFANYPSFTSGPAVTVPRMQAGDVGVVLSVLYSPFDEMDPTKLHGFGLPPEPRYFSSLRRQLELVERDIAVNHHDTVTIPRSPDELDRALEHGQIALIHAVEGGFALGATPAEIDRNVGELAAKGVAYVTLAHLFYRSVATNAAAIPFLPDWLYHALFRQPRAGLTGLGESAVRAMAREGVLIDITHMSERSIDETFSLLDHLDPKRQIPVIASHIACRIGDHEYNLSRETIARVAGRGGVLGVIFCEHYASDGIRRRRTRTFADTVEVVCSHIDRIHEVTGSHDTSALGSDLDGYIKPMLTGLEDLSKVPTLRQALAARYGAEIAEKICAGNALRVLHRAWRRRMLPVEPPAASGSEAV